MESVTFWCRTETQKTLTPDVLTGASMKVPDLSLKHDEHGKIISQTSPDKQKEHVKSDEVARSLYKSDSIAWGSGVQIEIVAS